MENSAVVFKESPGKECRGAVDMPEGDSVKFATTRFGELEVSSERIITFNSGLPGFPGVKSFVLLDYEDEEVPFKWLQSVCEPAVAFIVMDPLIIKPDYELTFKRNEIADLGDGAEEDFAIFVILTIPEGKPEEMTANLMAPLLLNSATMTGKQVVLDNAAYPLKYRVLN